MNPCTTIGGLFGYFELAACCSNSKVNRKVGSGS